MDLAFQAPTETYKGAIRQADLAGVAVGGETAFPFHTFEGEMPNDPKLAFEVWDIAPDDWSSTLNGVYGEVFGDPVAWAKKAVADFGADMIYLRLRSTDPNGAGRAPAEAAAAAKAVVEAVDVPVIVVGSGDIERDPEVLKVVAETLADHKVVIGNAEEDTYRSIGAAAMGYQHGVVAFSPMDVNLAKQLNVLLSQLGLDEGAILMDPTTGALGYGLEYAYTVFERDRLAALSQNDPKMQMPIVATVGQEAWKAKETKVGEDELPGTGDMVTRGLMWESLTAVALLLAGANIVVLRHPDSAGLIRKAVASLKGE
ncbi:MAG: acetyl-CoA decarbonylase/synthase complex subunit delta [Thermoleophilia bacterium]